MREELRDLAIIYDVWNRHQIGHHIWIIIVGMILTITLLTIIIGTLSLFSVALIPFLFALFIFSFSYAYIYGKSSFLCSVGLLTVSTFFLVHKTILLNGNDGYDYNYLFFVFLFLFSIFSGTYTIRPPTSTIYNMFRFIFVFIYSGITTLLVAWVLARLTGIIDFNDTRVEDIFTRINIAMSALVFFIGGLMFNHLFFVKFQWKQLRHYIDLVKKYGERISEKDAALFRTKLNTRFPNGWNLLKERDNPNNKWEDRIMFAYLADKLIDPLPMPKMIRKGLGPPRLPRPGESFP